MATNIHATAISHSSADRFAEVMEQIGLAIMGALCGLFVAAFVARADIGGINSLGALFAAILYGSSGFYFGTAAHRPFAGAGPGPDPIALANAVGTLLAATAALLSVYMIIFDEAPPTIWNVGTGLGWMLGVLLQLGGGAAARLRQFRRATG